MRALRQLGPAAAVAGRAERVSGGEAVPGLLGREGHAMTLLTCAILVAAVAFGLWRQIPQWAARVNRRASR